ncbi:AAA family ATPase [Acinetobacter sp. ANC 4640]
MINKYSIENFKVFSKKVDLKFAPITLIYGPNSSGKSSIIQSLIVLKESLLSSNVLKSNNSYFELGSYLSVVNNHNAENKIKFEVDDGGTVFKFEYGYSEEHKISYLNKCNINNKENNLMDLDFFVKNVSKQGGNFFNISYKEQFISQIFKSRKFIEEIKQYLEDKKPILDADIDKFLKKTTFTRKNNLLPVRVSRNGNDLIDLKDDEIQRINSIFYQELTSEISGYINKNDRKLHGLLGNLTYIGPLRPHPKRVYQLDGVTSNTVGQNGENFLSFLAVEEKYVKSINSLLEDFNIKYEVEVVRSNDIIVGDMASILLRDKKNNIQTTLVDVGFGIGQVLPILIEGLVKERAIICIEQPEIHLHPKLQADLANFFVKDIKSNKSNQWIIETHSESLLLRFQRLIRHKIIKPEDVSIIYVDPCEDGVKTIHIPLDEDGDFTVAWPNGFFEERLDEMFGNNPFGEE